MVIPMTQPIFPHGIFFLVVLFTIHALWKLASAPKYGMALEEAGLGIYASLVAVRQMMELRPALYDCAVFFNGPAFLVFIILLCKMIRWACRSFDKEHGDFVAGTMLAAEAVLLFLLFFPRPQMLSTRLTTENGSFCTRPDVATLFPQIISFMKTHTRNGKDILVLPEPPKPVCFCGDGGSQPMVFACAGICGAGAGATVHRRSGFQSCALCPDRESNLDGIQCPGFRQWRL
jgi:hypothetical protein